MRFGDPLVFQDPLDAPLLPVARVSHVQNIIFRICGFWGPNSGLKGNLENNPHPPPSQRARLPRRLVAAGPFVLGLGFGDPLVFQDPLDASLLPFF